MDKIEEIGQHIENQEFFSLRRMSERGPVVGD